VRARSGKGGERGGVAAAHHHHFLEPQAVEQVGHVGLVHFRGQIGRPIGALGRADPPHGAGGRIEPVDAATVGAELLDHLTQRRGEGGLEGVGLDVDEGIGEPVEGPRPREASLLGALGGQAAAGVGVEAQHRACGDDVFTREGLGAVGEQQAGLGLGVEAPQAARSHDLQEVELEGLRAAGGGGARVEGVGRRSELGHRVAPLEGRQGADQGPRGEALGGALIQPRALDPQAKGDLGQEGLGEVPGAQGATKQARHFDDQVGDGVKAAGGAPGTPVGGALVRQLPLEAGHVFAQGLGRPRLFVEALRPRGPIIVAVHPVAPPPTPKRRYSRRSRLEMLVLRRPKE
jgi:hypothetical protein